MTDEDHQAQLDAVQAEIAALAAAAFEELMQRLRDGQAPREALAAVTATFQGQYSEALAREFGRLLGRSVSPDEIRALPVGDLKLSDRLYRQSRETSAVARTIIQNHAQGFQDARKLALQLYEDYEFKTDPLKVKAALPKYLREAMQDPAIDGGLRLLFAKIRATNLKTPGLRAAYLQALDAIEKGAGEAWLKKLLKIAWYERNRYFANRIAQTELHRAYEDEKAREFMADDSLRWVQVRLSRAPRRTDICDLHARLDKFGLGPGVYPKAEAPKPTFHPFCRCALVPRWDLEGEGKARPHAERAFFESLPADEGRKVAGSFDKLRRILDGENWEKVIDGNTDPLYRLQRVGDTMKPVNAAAESMLKSLIDRARQSESKGVELLKAVWSNPNKFSSHVVKRIETGHTLSAEEYAAQTFSVLAHAKTMTLAIPSSNNGLATGRLRLKADDWIVLLGNRGEIVTSYRYEPGKETFDSRHARMGDAIYDYAIPDEIRRILAQIFDHA
jgi:hypothetical protein